MFKKYFVVDLLFFGWTNGPLWIVFLCRTQAMHSCFVGLITIVMYSVIKDIYSLREKQKPITAVSSFYREWYLHANVSNYFLSFCKCTVIFSLKYIFLEKINLCNICKTPSSLSVGDSVGVFREGTDLLNKTTSFFHYSFYNTYTSMSVDQL